MDVSLGATVVVRNPTNGGVLECTPNEWRAFVASVKAGEHDLPEPARGSAAFALEVHDK